MYTDIVRDLGRICSKSRCFRESEEGEPST